MTEDRAAQLASLNALIADMIEVRARMANNLAETERQLAMMKEQRWAMVLTP